MLSAILILLYAYIYVWSRGPQDGKLSRMVRRLRKGARYWRKRALRDEAILSRVIDKKFLALVAFLCLFLIPVVNPSPSAIPAAIGNEHQEAMFSTAADGDESSESIEMFAETSSDDVFLYPDSDSSLDISVAESYVHHEDCADTIGWAADGGIGGWDVFTSDGDEIYANYTTAGVRLAEQDNTEPSVTSIDGKMLILSFKWATNQTSGTMCAVNVENTAGTLQDAFDCTDYSQSTWHTAYYDLSIADDYGTLEVLGGSTTTDGVLIEIWLDYIVLTDPILYDNRTSGYAESFADVSDWSASGSSTVTSDGDVMTHDAASGDDADSDGPSFASMVGLYVEFRIKANVSVSVTFSGAHADGISGGWAFQQGLGTITTNWVTKKYYVPSMSAYSAGALESIRFYPSSAAKVYFDCLRIGPATEMGWAHDGSTTAGWEAEDEDCAYTISTDGDIITANMTYDDTVAWVGWALYTDTTATQGTIERDYYQFYEMRVRVTKGSGYMSSGDVGIWCQYDDYGEVNNTWDDGNTEWTIIRGNIKASTTSRAGRYYFSFYAQLEAGQSVEYQIDYVKIFSIANYTYTGSGVGTDDYLYVDSGVLYSHIDDGYIELNHDPALSVSDTYSVYNLTTSGTAPEFSQYVSEWSTYSDDTRGATTSGTVMDIRLKFDSTETLSAIKFIEDSTAPDADIVVSPNPPDDDEQVTLSSIVFDDVEVWKVWYNAISYPTGFSDVDYSATEGQENYWSYSFSSLIAGDYCFKVIANDGANNNTVTEANRDYATVRFTVREAAITISTYTFFGASSDFSYMQYSGHISHDCTYNISEWSTTWAKNETHTGSVTEGMFNIAWDKITVDDAEANFTIVFVSGSLSLTIEGYYGTAYKLLRITEIVVVNMEDSLALTNITITFYTNKDVDWYVYDRDDDDAVLSSGSSVEGGDDLYFLKNRIPYAHFYAVKWDDGVTQIWYNSSYWTYRQNIDAVEPAGVDWGAKDQRKTIEFWVTVTAIIGGFGLIVLGIMNYDTREKLKKLQLPSYRTQERDRK